MHEFLRLQQWSCCIFCMFRNQSKFVHNLAIHCTIVAQNTSNTVIHSRCILNILHDCLCVCTVYMCGNLTFTSVFALSNEIFASVVTWCGDSIQASTRLEFNYIRADSGKKLSKPFHPCVCCQLLHNLCFRHRNITNTVTLHGDFNILGSSCQIYFSDFSSALLQTMNYSPFVCLLQPGLFNLADWFEFAQSQLKFFRWIGIARC